MSPLTVGTALVVVAAAVVAGASVPEGCVAGAAVVLAELLSLPQLTASSPSAASVTATRRGVRCMARHCSQILTSCDEKRTTLRPRARHFAERSQCEVGRV